MHLIIKPHRPIADSNMHQAVSGAGAQEQHDLLKRGAGRRPPMRDLRGSVRPGDIRWQDGGGSATTLGKGTAWAAFQEVMGLDVGSDTVAAAIWKNAKTGTQTMASAFSG